MAFNLQSRAVCRTENDSLFSSHIPYIISLLIYFALLHKSFYPHSHFRNFFLKLKNLAKTLMMMLYQFIIKLTSGLTGIRSNWKRELIFSDGTYIYLADLNSKKKFLLTVNSYEDKWTTWVLWKNGSCI